MSSIGLTILIGVVTFGLTALSGHLTTRNVVFRYTFWIGACVGVVLVSAQSVRTTLENRGLAENSATLIDKIDKVKVQNQSVLTLLTEQHSSVPATLGGLSL